ncbi:MAG: hypothetical protein JW990_18360, partial [Thermoleophilia bacterium]|nr:hypothetical protein [Thermoleophilia bacterium]
MSDDLVTSMSDDPGVRADDAVAVGEAPQPAEAPSPGSRRLGVYVCQCGGNISDYVSVDDVVAAVKD